MAFDEYRTYTATELERIFSVTIKVDGDLFADFQPSGNLYAELQTRVNAMQSRISVSRDAGNEATRGSLLVSHSCLLTVLGADKLSHCPRP